MQFDIGFKSVGSGIFWVIIIVLIFAFYVQGYYCGCVVLFMVGSTLMYDLFDIQTLHGDYLNINTENVWKLFQ